MKHITNFSNDEIGNRVNTKLSDYDDWEIENEFDDRCLTNCTNLNQFEDYQIKDEYKSRGLYVLEDKNIEDLINEINQDKPVLNKIRNLLEKSSGRLITKQIK